MKTFITIMAIIGTISATVQDFAASDYLPLYTFYDYNETTNTYNF